MNGFDFLLIFIVSLDVCLLTFVKVNEYVMNEIYESVAHIYKDTAYFYMTLPDNNRSIKISRLIIVVVIQACVKW